MNLKTTAIVVTVVGTVASFLLSDYLWPMSPDVPAATGTEIPLFIFLAAVESLAFGAGLAFLVTCWKEAAGNRLVFLAVAWSLISWWPHDNMHKHNGLDIQGLLVIEYVFHFTLIVAAFVIASYFWKRFHNVI